MKILRTTSLLIMASATLSGCNPFASSWADDCETAYKERLRSPATYKRIEADVFAIDMSVDEYLAQKPNLMAIEIDRLRERKSPIKNWKVLITYDAANAMGVPIRGKFYCEQITTTGEEPEGGRSEGELLIMKVNGKSNIELQTEALKEQFGQ
ncbi:hypothetical protein AB3G45_19710 [Shinella sp. S4-D37]|uniref:hypothetical protein n=1 Tax=Shinella sp. S4-D37 TaxID=3161999 RepID=UPI00346570F6